MDDQFGLFSKNAGPVPLMGVAVKGDILGRGARVRVSQRFTNTENKSIEAVYKFPLPEGAAICGFKALVDGREIHGEVEERDKAFEEYDKALSKGYGGFLLDEERPNIFALSLGNLKPGTEAIIEIEYVALLDMEGTRIRFFLPTTISPRYVPARMPDRDGIPEGERITPVYAETVPYGLSLALNIHQGNLIENIESPSHPIRVEMGREPLLVTFSSDSVKMDHDFILYMGCKEGFSSRAYRWQKEGEVFYQLDLLVEDGREKRIDEEKEILFVLDCSGSMQGDSIQEAKRALEVCLKGLEANTSFNIYLFGSRFHKLFDHPERYSEGSLARALEYLRRANADLGGTEVLGPLEHIYSNHPGKEGGRNIVLLTDGEVGNEEEVLNLVRRNRDHTRFFAIGIGAGPNEFLIKGLARAGGGAFGFIYPGERIEPKVLRIFQKVSEESMKEISIDWGEGFWEQAPQSPVVFQGSGFTVFAKSGGGKEIGQKSICVKGNLNGQERTWNVGLLEKDVMEYSPIPSLWARERIRDLEELGEDIRGGGSRQWERKGKQTRETIIELSKKFGILSMLTSFLAVEQREEKDQWTGEIVLRKVPVPVTMGWHGMGRITATHPSLIAMAAPLAMEARFIVAERYPLAVDAQRPAPMRKQQKIDLMMEILSLQSMKGGLGLTSDLAARININLEEIKKLAPTMELAISGDKFLILSTAILISVLKIYFLDEESTWGPVLKKTRDWLDEVVKRGNPMVERKKLMEWAEDYVRNTVKIHEVIF